VTLGRRRQTENPNSIGAHGVRTLQFGHFLNQKDLEHEETTLETTRCGRAPQKKQRWG
jgi:hypothetical protein